MVTRRYIVTAILALAFAFAVGALAYVFAGRDYAELAASGLQERGTVVRVATDRALVEFPTANGRAGRWHTVPGARVGDTISITHSPQHPYISAVGDARALYRRWRQSAAIYIGLAFIAPFAFVALRAVLRKPSNQSLEPTAGRRDVHILIL